MAIHLRNAILAKIHLPAASTYCQILQRTGTTINWHRTGTNLAHFRTTSANPTLATFTLFRSFKFIASGAATEHRKIGIGTLTFIIFIADVAKQGIARIIILLVSDSPRHRKGK
jgi:hypothetical protein